MSTEIHTAADDLMALADAVGVTAPTPSPGAPLFLVDMPTDVDAPVPFELTAAALGCGHCGDTGLVEHRSPFTGSEGTITCPACRGES